MFDSNYEEVGEVDLPQFSGIRVMMMPIVLGDISSLPILLGGWIDTIAQMFRMRDQHAGDIGYLTIDEKHVKAGETHRRAGLHVDGIYQGKTGAWGGGGGGWSSVGNGMLTVSSPAGCRAWRGRVYGLAGDDGECEHLRDQFPEESGELFRPGVVYWVDGLCVHESVPMVADVDRQFARLSMPSTAPWFEGYTEKPLGVKPTGPILPRRKYMDSTP